MGSKDDNLQTPTMERMKALATAKAAAEKLKSAGTSASTYGQQGRVPLATAQSIVDHWPEAPKLTATQLLEHYGPPHEATPSKLFWYATRPWARMELTADHVLHNFPTPHVDYFTQFVSYQVPPGRASDLAAFDGSVIVDRTSGQLGSRCDHEAFNTLTLNLAVEIIEGKRSLEDARELYAQTAAAYVMGRDAPYAERLRFTPVAGSADPDESVIASAMAEQMIEKVKDTFGAGDPPQ
ncbi:hypothetical protein [Arthrobacter sp. AQ5-05]|uniref:hypothetical protein n=1 Tax=Arthrobacter sp. AQ5-05 TaxID=2184581 RepID=UPI0011BE6628|nr:hypothetical protein [Arthrobacter sp. AQ5-05]